ncbi:hypothetical protein HWV62_3677 [Athelia sp. TMB]|nr:hypothetical protein HWV62_3677 [Athelia sp. TMB]
MVDRSRPIVPLENGEILVHAPAAKFPPPKPHNPHGHQHAAARATVTHTETVFVTHTAMVPAPMTTSVATHSADPVVFVFIMISVDSASEGAILLKSILMYNSKPTHFHIICDEAAQQYLEARLSLITRPANDIRVHFYHLTQDKIAARLNREGSIGTSHSAGAYGLMKLFIHEILPPSVKRAIYVDTDAFFISDPSHLWDLFHEMDPKIAISMPSHPEQNAAVWNHASNICSCIMLLDLQRLRDLRLMDSSVYRADPSGPVALSPATFVAMYGIPGESGHYEDVHLGDQGYFYAIVKHRPDIFAHLGFDWEVSSCLLDMYNTTLGHDEVSEIDEFYTQIHLWETPQAQVGSVLPKLLHFNCLEGTPRYYEWEGWSDPTLSLTQRWHPAVQYHVGFKWIWLNKHPKDRAGATLAMETTHDVVFADEVFAARIE